MIGVLAPYTYNPDPAFTESFLIDHIEGVTSPIVDKNPDELKAVSYA